MITLALRDSAAKPDTDDIQALFSERANLLSQIENADADAETLDVLRRVMAVERDALSLFQAQKGRIVAEIEGARSGKRVPGTYGQFHGRSFFDAMG